MHANQSRLIKYANRTGRIQLADPAVAQGNVRARIGVRPVGNHEPLAKLIPERNALNTLNQPLPTHPVLNQRRVRTHLQTVPPLELDQLRHPSHRAIFVENLDQSRPRQQASQPAEVHRTLGLTLTH